MSEKNPNRFEGAPKRLRVLAPSPSNWAMGRDSWPGHCRISDRLERRQESRGSGYTSRLPDGSAKLEGIRELELEPDGRCRPRQWRDGVGRGDRLHGIHDQALSTGAITMLLGALVVLAPIVVRHLAAQGQRIDQPARSAGVRGRGLGLPGRRGADVVGERRSTPDVFAPHWRSLARRGAERNHRGRSRC